jgi:glycosyltransferase involved in cell wall biosynthesis
MNIATKSATHFIAPGLGAGRERALCPPVPKVIHVLRKFEPAAWGGIETHLAGLVPELARLGWESEIHAPAERGTDGAPLEALGARFRTFRARYPYLGLTPERREALVACGGNLVAPGELVALAGRRDVDLFHVHTLGRLGGVVRLASRLAGVPYAVTLHGPVRANAAVVDEAARGRTDGLTDLGQPFGWLVGARRVVEDAALVFVLHEGERRAWEKARRGRHLEQIVHGVQPGPATAGERARARASIAGLGDAPFVLVLGRMEPAKGQDLALAAFLRARPPAHLVLAGSAASPAFAEGLRARAGEGVHVVGGVAPATARALLAEASLVVIPSRAEPFGIVLLEAWAEGSRTLFSDVDGLAHIAGLLGAREGAVPPADEAALAAKITAAFADPAPLAAEARRLQGEVRQRMSWSAVAGRLAASYETARAGRRVA